MLNRKNKRKVENSNNRRKSQKNVGGDSFFLDMASPTQNDQELSSDSEDEGGMPKRTSEARVDEDNTNETAEQKRLRIAKEYLLKLGDEMEDEEEIKDAQDEGSGEEGMGPDRLGQRLERARMEAMGQLQKKLAGELRGFEVNLSKIRRLRGHKLSPTCLALTTDDRTAYSGSKDNSIIKWDIETGQKQYLRPIWKPSKYGHKTHQGEVLAVAVSSDGKYLASGGRDRYVRVFDTRTNEQLESLPGHKDAVSSLVFRIGSHSLYSSSHDRCVNHWNIDEMGFVETLFGHQSFVNGIDSLRKERAVTASGDRTMRLWKILDETQLVFRGHTASIDAIKMVTEDWFVSGGQDGGLGLWFAMKKKPAYFVENAHGPGSWINSLGVCRGSDLLASGSNDGQIKLWQVQTEERSLTEVTSVPMDGFVNDISISSQGNFLVAAIGQEHKLGRWSRNAKAKNSVVVIPLQKDT